MHSINLNHPKWWNELFNQSYHFRDLIYYCKCESHKRSWKEKLMRDYQILDNTWDATETW